MSRIWTKLRDIRYAFPHRIEKNFSGPNAADTLKVIQKFDRRGWLATIGYFQARTDSPCDILAANLGALASLNGSNSNAVLSVKAPPLSFDRTHLHAIAQAAEAANTSIIFDAHAPQDAQKTLDIVEDLLADFPCTGFALPARWKRSIADAEHFKNSSARIRIVKGEWADPDWQDPDIPANYLALVAYLAGRNASVAIATHDPHLAAQAIKILQASGTPCELEQLRGLPSRRTMAVARQMHVPIRVYIPFGPGWWPYAIDKALSRPYLVKWMIQDRLDSP